MPNAAGDLTVGGAEIDRARIGAVLDVADQAAAQVRDLLVGGAVDRHHLDRRAKLAAVADDLMDELRQLVDLKRGPAVVLALLALLLGPLAELVAGEKFKALISEPDVAALALLRRVPILAGLGEDTLCALCVLRRVVGVAAGVAVGHTQPFLGEVTGLNVRIREQAGISKMRENVAKDP